MKKSILVCLLLSTVCYGAGGGWSEEDMARAMALSLLSPEERDLQEAIQLSQREEDVRVAARLVEEQSLEAQRQVDLREAARLAEQQKRNELRRLRAALRDAAQAHAVVLRGVAQGGDVHGLDAYVAPQLSVFVAQVQQALPHLQAPADLLGSIAVFIPAQFDYRDPDNVSTLIPKAEVERYAAAALATAAQDPNVVLAYSLHMAIIANLQSLRGDVRANMQEFINAICENYKTQGGCFQGVRNRGFIRLVDLVMTYFERMGM